MITICGSIAFYDEMLAMRDTLNELGITALLPPTEIAGEDGSPMDVRKYYAARKEKNPPAWVWERKAEAIATHFSKIEQSDAILVLNYDKNEIEGYIGANTLLEMGLAFYLKKPIYLLNKVPHMGYTEEILGMKPVVLEGDIQKIRELMKVPT